MELVQGICGWLTRTGIADAIEIATCVSGHGEHTWLPCDGTGKVGVLRLANHSPAKGWTALRDDRFATVLPPHWLTTKFQSPSASRHTGSSSCDHPGISGLASAVRSRISFSSTNRLVGGFERSARSVLATSRRARVSSRFDL